MSAATDARGITVTIKFGAGYEAPWIVFHGTPTQVHADLLDVFGVPEADAASLTMSDLVVNLSREARGVATVSTGLDAAVTRSPAAASTPSASAAATGPAASSSAPSVDPWSQAAETAPTPAENPILVRIAQAPDVKALARIWASDKAAFVDPEVMAAFKQRGKALNPAA